MSDPTQHPSAQIFTKGLQYVRGFPFPADHVTGVQDPGAEFSGQFYFKRENLETVLDYVPRDGDVLVSAYPRTGTTWLEYIVLQIMTKGEKFPGWGQGVAFMEFCGVEVLDALEQPRIYKTHVPYNLMKISKNAKYITMYRDPADTLVSYYHFQREMGDDRLEVEQFFEQFVTGDIAYGSYFEHVLSSYLHRNDPNLLILSYEKLLSDKRAGILKIAAFLGEEYLKDLENDDALLDKIIERTSFEYMKKNIVVNAPLLEIKKLVPNKKVDFFRKGTWGDEKNLLSSEQMILLRGITEEVMKGTDIAEEWLAERI